MEPDLIQTLELELALGIMRRYSLNVPPLISSMFSSFAAVEGFGDDKRIGYIAAQLTYAILIQVEDGHIHPQVSEQLIVSLEGLFDEEEREEYFYHLDCLNKETGMGLVAFEAEDGEIFEEFSQLTGEVLPTYSNGIDRVPTEGCTKETLLYWLGESGLSEEVEWLKAPSNSDKIRVSPNTYHVLTSHFSPRGVSRLVEICQELGADKNPH